MNNLKGKKVLVTGASGFIGSNLTRKLVSGGANVTVILRYNSVENNVRLSDLWDSINVYEADIRNFESLREIGKQYFDYIFHLAAFNHVGNSFARFGEPIETNARGTANILESFIEYERLVSISTSEVYGLQKPEPFVETMTPKPLSPYSVGKYAGELYSLLKYNDRKPIVVIRPFNTYGPYQSTRAVISELIVKCLRGKEILTTEGKQTREFNYVGDIVSGIIQGAMHKEAEGQVLNIGCGKDIAINDLAKLIHKISNSSSELKIGALPTRPNEIWKMSSDATLAGKVIGYKPNVSLEDGLKKTIEWFMEYLDVYHSSNKGLSRLGANYCNENLL